MKSDESRLNRAIGPRIATAVVVGSVIGSGIFLKGLQDNKLPY